MELSNKFAQLSEDLIAKLPNLDDFYLYIHILAFVAGFGKSGSYVFFSSSSKPIVNLTNLDKELLQKIKDSLLRSLNELSFSIDDLSENDRKELCRYFLEKCLNYRKPIKNSPRNSKEFLGNPLFIEPEAVSENDGWYNVDYSKLSLKSQKNLLNWEIENYLFYRTSRMSKFLAEKIFSLVNPRGGNIIYSPNCGDGSVFVEFHKKLPDADFEFRGVVYNQIEYLFCIVNLYVNDVLKTNQFVEISISSPFEDIPKWYYELKNEDDKTFRSSFREEAPEIAISVVPFTNKSNKELDYRFFGLSSNLKNEGYSYIELMLNATKETGKVTAVVPDSMLNSSEGRFFRESYLSKDWIESVFSIPEDALYLNSSVKTSIIVFNKRKKVKGVITFDGEGSQFEKTKVKTKKILHQNNIDLRPFQYASKESKELDKILAKSQYPVKKIKDLIYSAVSGHNYSPKDRIIENSAETLPYVRVADLARNETEFDLDISKVGREISAEKARKRTIIDFSAVLISKIAPKLKPTYFNFSGQKIVIGSDVVALKLKEDVDVEYFITQLNSRLVRLQVERASSGTTINRITTQDFLDIRIILPSLEEQQRQVLEIGGLIADKAIVEEKLVDAQFDVVASINHSLKNKLAVIVNDYDSLIRFFRRKERKKETVDFSEPISTLAVGDDIDTIEIITNRLKNNLSNASKVFNNALKIQRQNLKKDFVELVGFFRNEVKPLYAGKNYSIDIIAKPNLKLNVWLDKDAFKDVIENLIDNAKSHGFIDESKNYRIVFDLSKLENEADIDDNSTQYARIIYKNDGKPFPKDFSFEEYKQYLSKAGKTQGTGFGGYVVNKLIELHDGGFNFITPSDDFTVEFEILLPLEN